MRYVDSHCHLDRVAVDSGTAAEQLVANAHAAGVSKLLNVSIGSENMCDVVALAQQCADVYASVGIHPNQQESTEPIVEQLCDWAEQGKVIAIGETGLDYYYLDSPQSVSPTLQLQRFINHIEAAIAIQKPLIIHCRDAKEDVITTLQKHQAQQAGGIMHCFVEDYATAMAAIDLGFYISISGIVTFKNARELQQTVTKLPMERLLVETDAPYLAPVPYRGKCNLPQYVQQVVVKIAELKELSPEEVAQQTTDNFLDLFGLQ